MFSLQTLAGNASLRYDLPLEIIPPAVKDYIFGEMHACLKKKDKPMTFAEEYEVIENLVEGKICGDYEYIIYSQGERYEAHTKIEGPKAELTVILSDCTRHTVFGMTPQGETEQHAEWYQHKDPEKSYVLLGDMLLIFHDNGNIKMRQGIPTRYFEEFHKYVKTVPHDYENYTYYDEEGNLRFCVTENSIYNHKREEYIEYEKVGKCLKTSWYGKIPVRGEFRDKTFPIYEDLLAMDWSIKKYVKSFIR